MPFDLLRLPFLRSLEQVQRLAELALADGAFLLSTHVDQLRGPLGRSGIRRVEREFQFFTQVFHLVFVPGAHVTFDAVALVAERGDVGVPLAIERVPPRL